MNFNKLHAAQEVVCKAMDPATHSGSECWERLALICGLKDKEHLDNIIYNHIEPEKHHHVQTVIHALAGPNGETVYKMLMARLEEKA